MKVGILTYHFSENYGALFQAYALRHWFVSHGYDAEFVNYHPDYVEAGGSIKWGKPISKDNLKIIFLKLVSLKERYLGDRKQKKNFEIFREHGLGVKGAGYRDVRELEKAKIQFDILVCGSDQVWKPSEHYGVDPVYFLDFQTPGSPRRISYAPSFGKCSLDAQYSAAVAALISKLDGVSVREQSGCKIVQALTGIEPSCVPDPTLLLSDYSQIMKPYPLSSSKHVFCYALRSRDAIGDAAEVIASALNADLISPHNPHRRWREIGETVYPCPSQWLYLLKTSEFVVTNSFHGTALSILLNKPFVVVGLQGGKKDLNARVMNLLSLLGLDSRFVQDVNSAAVEEVLDNPLDWADINARVSKLREAGNDYLDQQLKEI